MIVSPGYYHVSLGHIRPDHLQQAVEMVGEVGGGEVGMNEV